MVIEGYKETEAGVIPEDWDIKSMHQLTSLMTNGFVGTIKTEYVPSGTGVLYLQGFNIKENSFDLTGVTYVSYDFHKKHKKSELRENDLLTVQTGNIGTTAYLPKKFEGANCQALIISRFLESYDSRFWSYYFNSPIGHKALTEIETGSTMKHINVGDMKNIFVPVPSKKEEQQKIAEALSDMDSLVSSLEKLIEKKKSIKQGAMQELLTGRKRLPGFSGEWKKQSFGKLCTICRGGSPRPIQNFLTNEPNGVNWIKIGDVGVNDKYINSTAEKIKESGVNMSRRVYKGDFILSNSMSFGRPYILNIDGCIHDGWLAIQDYQKAFNIDFLYYLLSSNYVFEQYIQMAAGSSVQNLNKEKVAQLSVYVPTIEEQNEIALILSDIDEEITALEQKLAKCQKLKQGMMQQLLTGKIRLI